MSESPEMYHLGKQLHRAIAGQTIEKMELTKPKNYNVPVKTFGSSCKGKAVSEVTSRGMRGDIRLEDGQHVPIFTGMGACFYLHKGDNYPDKYSVDTLFSNDKHLSIHFMCFNNLDLVKNPAEHPKPGICPMKKMDKIDRDGYIRLYKVIRQILNDSVKAGSANRLLHDKGGNYKFDKVCCREGEPCPVCGTKIEMIKTGSTSSFICSECQKP